MGHLSCTCHAPVMRVCMTRIPSQGAENEQVSCVSCIFCTLSYQYKAPDAHDTPRFRGYQRESVSCTVSDKRLTRMTQDTS